MNRPSRSRPDAKSPKPFTRLLPLRNIALLLVAVSILQYFSEGRVTWPADTLEAITNTVGEYIGRPEAGWRQASDKIEDLGATREQAPAEFDITGRVVRVADGDTLSILDSDKQQHKIRLHGIDTPERDQAYGKSARKALSKLVSGKNVGIVVVETDQYGRTVGRVYLQDTNINLAMVAGGHAWWYRRHAQHNRPLEVAEKAARKAQRGLWADPDPQPPWQWRREQF